MTLTLIALCTYLGSPAVPCFKRHPYYTMVVGLPRDISCIYTYIYIYAHPPPPAMDPPRVAAKDGPTLERAQL